MKIEGSHTLKIPRAQLYRMLIDPVVIQRCVPGCEALEAHEDGTYKMTLKAGVGSVKGVFNGQIKLDELREPEHYKMIVEGTGKVGFVKGAGLLDLVEQGNETIVNYTGDVSIGGNIASVGQRMVQAAAKMMAGQFFKAVEAEANPDEAPKPGLVKRLMNRVAGSAEDSATPPEQP
ncbi:MAG: carbon monoxide dehydrogenase subunit G [Acidobacteria bacterium]|nr:carbon monoxide dehydrogenase subunit G [Acidobacteriota bacterium]MBI3428259.1 carbon monoxide dehydrogenase subunit G [Acidobacteriota bacterium]